jgi:hypothetical protein
LKDIEKTGDTERNWRNLQKIKKTKLYRRKLKDRWGIDTT